MHISALKKSNFLTRNDVGRGMLVTIKNIVEENVAKEGAPQEMRWCLFFNEQEKPMVLNSTNGQIIASITKSEDTDQWPGHKIVLYDDPNVSFGGKLVGGIRVRAPRPAPAPVSAPVQSLQTRALTQAAPGLPPQSQAPEAAPYDDSSDVPFK